MRFPEGREKALTLSYDDGSKCDKRLVEILNNYGIKATLNINSEYVGIDERHLDIDEIKAISEDGIHEIAIHGARHIATGNVSAVVGMNDMLECRKSLERSLGKIIRGMAYPDTGISVITSGISKAEIKTYLKRLGIAYGRTLGGDNDRFGIPNDFYEWMPTAHHANPKLMEWTDKFVSGALPSYRAMRSPWLFYLWGHSCEFENKWELLEEFCRKTGNNDSIWYATNIEIYDYVTAYRSLIFNVDCTEVFNPTCIKVWFEADSKEIISVSPGERKRI